MHVPFKFDNDHSILMVPEEKLQEVRVNLSEQGLPKSNSIGFELLDQEKFGISQFNEQINYQRALEGELARSIQKLNNIKTARVHIAFPKPSLFVQDKKFPSASIIIEVKQDSDIEVDQINAILHMVSSSISGLSIENISIIDQKGKLLNSSDSLNSNVDNTKLKYYDLIEEHYKQRIENILIPLLGLNNVHAQVTAQINFDKKESTEEKYKPNYANDSKSIRSHQSTKNIELNEKYTDNSISPNSFSGKLKILSEKLSSDSYNSDNFSSKSSTLKNESSKNVNNSLTLPKSSTNQDYIVNYELDRTITRTKLQMGDVKRLSVAVVINYVRNKNGDWVSLSSNQIKKIENLIQAAIGFSSKRGDFISIDSALFVKPSIYVHEDVSFWKHSLLLNNTLEYGLILVFLIMLLLLYKIFFSKKNFQKNNLHNAHDKNVFNNDKKKFDIEQDSFKKILMEKGFGDISTRDTHAIAMIIKKWMSGDKK